MRISTRRRSTLSTAFALLMILSLGAPAWAADPPTLTPSGARPTLEGRVTGSKSATSRLAETDAKLLARKDSAMVNVVIKLDVDSVAVYEGGIADLAPTSPRVTGKALDSDSAAVKAYSKFVASRQDAFSTAVRKAVPSAKLGVRLDTVYGGVAARIPASAVEKVLAIKGVVAVQYDTLAHPLTDSSPSFIDADPLYGPLGGTPNAGKGIIFGDLDTGVWPEHPSFADQGNLPAPPPKADATPRACNFGDNPLTPATDVFVCNNKLIGGQPFLTTYLSDPGRAGLEPYHTARDSNGHGTHTTSTAAGNVVASAKIFGIERGPIHGIAPGAYVIEYKVCGLDGCFGSDSAAAVAQAILDGVKVINFSISGGTDPMTDPVELAFLDAYAAGVSVAASAGNEGPGASTANHLSPWVTTVAASTQRREFDSTLTVSATGGDTATFVGASIGSGVATSTPVVLASAAPYSRALCDAPAPAGLFVGKIVACQRGGNGRVEKGFNVKQGGAVGMVLYNATLADVETDNHFVPTVHLADGTAFLAFVNGHAGVTASFTAGTKQNGQADVMAAFSSRGPAGNFIKPDVTAPGVQILGGHSPTPDEIAGGPAGEYFQAIAGTSMSGPHVAGASILVRASHPSWTPGQVKSALMLTAITNVKKEDLTTPADPFDFGSGRIDVAAAAASPLTLDESAADFAALTADELNAIHLNIASINAPVMPGRITTNRTVTNTTDKKQKYEASTTSPAGSKISVSPTTFELKAGASKTLKVTIESDAPLGDQQFGAVKIVAKKGSSIPLGWRLHLPVAFIHTQGDVSLTQSCAPGTIKQGETTVCTVEATNNSAGSAAVDLTTKTDGKLKILSATGATQQGSHKVTASGNIAGSQPGVPSVAPGTIAGYIPLDLFGGTVTTPIGDEQILNFTVPAFLFNGVSYTTVGIDSNGYAIAGGGTTEDNNCCNLSGIPDPARPNNVLAPFWTDLDGTGATGTLINVLTDGVNTWIVIEWRVNDFGTNNTRVFQTWIGVDAVQDIAFSYDFASISAPSGQDFQVGAENAIGQGNGLGLNVLPTVDLLVTSTAPTPAASLTYSFTAKGADRGTGKVVTEMNASTVSGVTIVKTDVVVTKK